MICKNSSTFNRESKLKIMHRRTPSQADITAFKELTKKDALISLRKELNRLLFTALPGSREKAEKEFLNFEKLFQRFLKEEGSAIDWNRIESLPEDAIISYSKLPEVPLSSAKEILGKLVVVKLNGGLGTSMGCEGPKSLILVRNELTFLDVTIQQLEYLNTTYGCDVPLVLMNSFNTDEDTEKILHKYLHVNVKIYTFSQSMYPRIEKETLLPLSKSLSSKLKDEWYPPGHGDFYYSFSECGLLDKFIEIGKEYVFISNIDNLGATVDLNILNFLLHPGEHKPVDFLMELTDKTRADVKGGTLVNYDGKLRLLEIAQVPKEHTEEFKSVQKFKLFNTNNMWINLKAIKKVIEEQSLHMEVIVNPKTLDNGLTVIQLETASGAAIKCFDGALGINVPRSRFLPVKTTSDLLLIMSNLFVFNRGCLTMNPKRSFPTVPLVKLGDTFKKVQHFLTRFQKIPDCLELDSLTVAGDVTFGGNITLRGTVIVIANHGDRIDIPPGAILDNKIVSGNLRILEH